MLPVLRNNTDLWNDDFFKPFESFFTNTNLASTMQDIEETNENYEITIEAAGLDKDSLKITAHNNRIKVIGKRKIKDNTYQLQKIYLLPYSNVKSINAEYENGILTIQVKKTEASKEKQIPVEFK